MGKKKVIEKTSEQTKSAGKDSASAPKKKSSKTLEQGRIYVKASYNNTSITVTDDKGNVVAWASAGGTGFSGPKKATPFAASKVIASIMEKISKTGPHKVDIYVSGVGSGRDSAIRTLATQELDILSIKDINPIAHNGPRPRKQRRM
ncbi:MAG: 30S ribosomal protein S11 [Candidatus Colwellbacteria bacterium]|nr:30S ribosomal protein S11 [Candidatus Colwellbacteria bacterium]